MITVRVPSQLSGAALATPAVPTAIEVAATATNHLRI